MGSIDSNKLKKQCIRLGIIILIFISSFALLFVGLSLHENPPKYYTLPDDENSRLKIQDGKYYWNDTELDYIEPSFWGNLWVSIQPIIWFLILATIGGFFAIKLLSNMPPGYMCRQIIGLKTKATVTGVISLPEAPGGVIGIRYWYIGKNKKLVSTARGTIWENNSLVADVTPEINGWRGVYAYRFGADPGTSVGYIAGIVSLSGRIVGHKDSILRAQKCTILMLITDKSKNISIFKERYHCPVVYTSNIDHTIDDWLMSREGVFWLSHNVELIDGKIREKFDKDINEISAYQEFGRR